MWFVTSATLNCHAGKVRVCSHPVMSMHFASVLWQRLIMTWIIHIMWSVTGASYFNHAEFHLFCGQVLDLWALSLWGLGVWVLSVRFQSFCVLSCVELCVCVCVCLSTHRTQHQNSETQNSNTPNSPTQASNTQNSKPTTQIHKTRKPKTQPWTLNPKWHMRNWLVPIGTFWAKLKPPHYLTADIWRWRMTSRLSWVQLPSPLLHLKLCSSLPVQLSGWWGIGSNNMTAQLMPAGEAA